MIGSAGSRIGSLCRASQSRRGAGFPAAAFCCCADARCAHLAAAPPTSIENSRRFTVTSVAAWDEELLQFTSGWVRREGQTVVAADRRFHRPYNRDPVIVPTGSGRFTSP